MKLLLGDCLDKLKELEDNSVDSIVTDPPYGLEFMGKEWDSFKTGRISKYKEGGKLDVEAIQSRKGKGGAGPSYTKRAAKKCRTCGKQEWSGSPCKCETPDFEIDNSTQHTFQSFNEAWATECYRVLKPGGHLLAFGGSRMYHRLACGIEDAGFEIRDQIMWIYGSGFPKSHNIGKAIDKIEGNVRAVVGETKAGKTAMGQNSGWNAHENRTEIEITKGNSEWEGWGTALKPAHEPIVMARKPLIGTVADNVLEYGVGGLNIDGCRVGNEKVSTHSNGVGNTGDKGIYGTFGNQLGSEEREGRFPANVIMDEEAGKILDEQSGTTKSSKRGAHNNKKTEHTNTYTPPNALYSDDNTYGDEGGASRFFYCPKASKSDRDEGMDLSKDKQRPGQTDKGLYSSSPVCKDCGKTVNGTNDHSKCKEGLEYRPSTTTRKNIHPTVKPTELMKYLIRLVTPKGGVVLDPFMGSGSTGKAAVREGMEFIGIEREEEYYEIAKQRIENETNKRKFW
jgi:site-specific DNA-methyltransferase (adenine-specific)